MINRIFYVSKNKTVHNLYISNFYVAKNLIIYTKDVPIEVVINVSDEQHNETTLKEYKEKNIIYHYQPIQDYEKQELIESCVKPVAELINQYCGKCILVHCKEGISRSVSCLIYFMMSDRDLSFDDALNRVKIDRPIAHPNPGFRKQLINHFSKEGKEEIPKELQITEAPPKNPNISREGGTCLIYILTDLSRVNGTNIYISTYETAANINYFLPDPVIEIVINVHEQPHEKNTLEKFSELKVESHFFPMYDNEKQKIIETCEKVYDIIEKNPDKKILVHCYAGISRSVACVCYYLIRSKKINFWESLKLIRESRIQAHPNEGFIDQLVIYYLNSLNGINGGKDPLMIDFE